MFEGKIGFESMHCMRDDENNYRDYRILLGRGNDPSPLLRGNDPSPPLIGDPETARRLICPHYMKQRILKLGLGIYVPLLKGLEV